MRMLILLLIPITLFAQQAERDRTRELLDAAYRQEAVKEHCLAEPEGVYRATVEDMPVPVDCALWNRWYEAEQKKKPG